MLDESICHFRGILSFLFYFWWKILLANTVDPDQTPHYVASDLGLHCLPSPFTGFQVRSVNGSRHVHINSDKIRWASGNGQPAYALAVWSVNPYVGIMGKSRYLQEPVLKSPWSHKYHYNDLIQIGFNGFDWQVYSIISDKQKLPKSNLRTIYNKVASYISN